jgi:hypothetical protein
MSRSPEAVYSMQILHLTTVESYGRAGGKSSARDCRNGSSSAPRARRPRCGEFRTVCLISDCRLWAESCRPAVYREGPVTLRLSGRWYRRQQYIGHFPAPGRPNPRRRRPAACAIWTGTSDAATIDRRGCLDQRLGGGQFSRARRAHPVVSLRPRLPVAASKLAKGFALDIPAAPGR